MQTTAVLSQRRPGVRKAGLALVVLLLTLGFVATQAPPAHAVTFERFSDRVVITSKRMSARKVNATATVTFFSNGNVEFKVDAHNTGRIKKNYQVWGSVTSAGLNQRFDFNTGAFHCCALRIDGTWAGNNTRTRTWRTYESRVFREWDAFRRGALSASWNLQVSWS
jgi:hypothetical protein